MKFPGGGLTAAMVLAAALVLPATPAFAVSGQAASTETAVEAQYAGDSTAAPGKGEVKGVGGSGTSPTDDGGGGTAPTGDVVPSAGVAQEAQPTAAQPLGDALPFTGAELLTLLLAGGALIGTGVVLRRLGRTGRPDTMAG